MTAHLDHPNIPAIFEAGETEAGDLFMLLRLVDGEDLRTILRRSFDGLPTSLRDRIMIFLKICDAVRYAHSRKIIHRDLKPENIMIGRFGEVQVIDWGLARDLSESDATDQAAMAMSRVRIDNHEGFSTLDKALRLRLTRQDGFLGTAGYASPEQIGHERVDERSDIFSLGLILTEILTSKPALCGDSYLALLSATLQGQVRSPRDIDPTIPVEIDLLVRRATAIDQDLRISTVQELQQGLELWLAGEARRSSAGARRFGLIHGLCLFLLALVILAGFELATRAPPSPVKLSPPVIPAITPTPSASLTEIERATLAGDWNEALRLALAASSGPDGRSAQAIIARNVWLGRWPRPAQWSLEYLPLDTPGASSDGLDSMLRLEQLRADPAALLKAIAFEQKRNLGLPQPIDLWRAEAEQALGMRTEARASLDRLISQDPAWAEGFARRAQLSLEDALLWPGQSRGPLALAKEDLERARVLDSKNPLVCLARARWFEASGNFNDARAELASLGRILDPAIEEQVAALLIGLGEARSAELRLRGISETRVSAVILRIRANLTLGNNEDAMALIDRMTRINSDCRLLLERAELKLRNRDLESGRKDLEALIPCRDLPVQLCARGLLALTESQWLEAERNFSALLDLFPLQPRPLFLRAVARLHRGGIAEAVMDLERFQRLDPNGPDRVSVQSWLSCSRVLVPPSFSDSPWPSWQPLR